MIRSLKGRLLIGIIGGMLLLLVAFSTVVYTIIKHSLTEQFDSSLAATARMLAASVERNEDGNLKMESSVENMPEFCRAKHPTYYQFWREDGTVSLRSALLDKDNLLRFDGEVDEPIYRALKLKNGYPGRAVGLKFILEPKDEDREDEKTAAENEIITLVAARDATNLYHNLELLRWLLLTASIGTIIASLVIASLVVREGLGPLNSLAAEIADIKADDLTVRVGAYNIPTEMVPVKERLNDLLSRLEASFKRERRFTADVAHELRTPLAGMRSILEVTLTRNRDANEYKASLFECLAITQNMKAMIDSLLALARLDAHQMTFTPSRIRPAELVNSCWRQFSDKAAQRNIVFANRTPPEITFESDVGSLSMVLSNILGNAVEYADEGGQIWTVGQQVGEYIEIAVSNTGCRLTDGQISQVFDRFWRGDLSRKDTGVHCGLGLALVQKIIRALGGEVSAQVQQREVITIKLTLPAEWKFNGNNGNLEK